MSGLADALLADIVAHPDDDTPRLVYADWLSENGQEERAELIRVQIERTRLPEWDTAQVRLRLREMALLRQHGKKWMAALPKLRGVTWSGFRRGFVGEARFTSFITLRSQAAACWAATPVEALSIRWPRSGEDAASLPPIPGLRELSINAPLISAPDAGRLADAPLLSTVRVLDIRGHYLGADNFARLMASPHLGVLRAIRMPGNYIGGGGIDALRGAAVPSLEELDLAEESGYGAYGRYGEDPVITSEAMESLATWPGLARVRSLRLSGNEAGRAGLRALLRSPFVGRLKELALRTNSLTAAALKELAEARAGLRLDALDVGENVIGDGGAPALPKADCLSELKSLRLDRCEMGLPVARAIARAPFIRTLRRLDVSNNWFGVEGLQAILNAAPPLLHTLHINDNSLADDAATLLAESPATDTLLELALEHNDLGADTAKALRDPAHLRNLLFLRLLGNPIRKRAASSLAKSPLAKRLAVLDIPYHAAPHDGDWKV